MIWGAMGIPLLMAVVLLVFFHHRTKWWEFAIPFAVSLVLVAGFKVMSEHVGTKDYEFWGGWVTSAHYYEDWNQYIHQTCYRTVSCGKNCTTTVPYDCSYVAYHAEYWKVVDSNGFEHRVKQDTYNFFVQLFGMNPQLVDMRRPHHTNDGDMYQVLWPKTDATVEPVVTQHNYENRVQMSRSVFNYRAISRKDAQANGLIDYPEVSLFNYPSVLGDCGETAEAGNEKLMFHNATMGKRKQIRMWFLCFRGQSLDVAHLQEAYWVGGNKNEVVMTVGLDDENHVQWSHVFSWSDEESFKVEIRDHLVGQGTLDVAQAIDFAAPLLEESFARKHFADFSYLTIEPPLWAVITTFLVTLLVNTGLSYFIVVNEWDDDQNRSYWDRRSWRR